MKRRSYSRALRQEVADLTRRRIVEAAVALHAERGASHTSHALIARRAGVSVPTVYKYFPTPNDVVPACTAHVLERAPVRLDEGLFGGRTRVADRLAALASALFRFHEYLAPWLNRPLDADAFPAFRDVTARLRETPRRLAVEALRPGFRGAPPDDLVGPAAVLLSFPSWKELTSGARTSAQAAAVVAAAIDALYRGHGRKGDEDVRHRRRRRRHPRG